MAGWQLSARSGRRRFFSKADADPEQSTITGQSAGGMSISAPDRAVCSGKQSAGVGWCRSGTGQETTFMPTVSTVGFSAEADLGYRLGSGGNLLLTGQSAAKGVH